MRIEDFDLVPDGWVKAFGEEMVKEFNKVDRGIKVLEAKEKYGELRLNVFPYTDEAEDICDKYREISKHICAVCGKPDVPMMRLGVWVSPVCKGCWPKFSKHDYEKCVADSYRCPAFITVKHPYGDDVETSRIDLEYEMKKIRRRYKNESIDNTSSNGNADALAD